MCVMVQKMEPKKFEEEYNIGMTCSILVRSIILHKIRVLKWKKKEITKMNKNRDKKKVVKLKNKMTEREWCKIKQKIKKKSCEKKKHAQSNEKYRKKH